MNIHPVPTVHKPNPSPLTVTAAPADEQDDLEVDNCCLSAAAIDDLARSGITPDQAAPLGMFSVESARADLQLAEFRDQAALVLPYFDAAGELVRFERDGQSLPFCRVRYLGTAAPQ